MMLNSFIEMVPITLSQSLMYALVAMAVCIPFRFLGFSDLSSEGSFPLGGALCASLVLLGLDPISSLFLATMAGAAVGLFTGWMHLKFRINPLLCGVLVITMMYSVILRVMGKPNLSLLEHQTIFSLLHLSEDNLLPKILFLGFFVLVLVFALLTLLRTEFGLRMRAVGANSTMAQSQGISTFVYTLFGLGFANGLASLSGALVVQSQGYADAGMGFGVLINGLAALMLGEFILKPISLGRQILAPVVGSIAYYQVTSLVLSIGLEPSDLKFVSGAFVLFILALPSLKRRTL